MPWRENKGVANLNGIYTDGFYSLKARNLWRKSLIKIWPMARNNLPLCLHKYNLQLKSLTKMRSSSGCCPGLGKPLGFQPVFACVSKSLEES